MPPVSIWNTLGQQLWNGVLNGAVYVIFASGLSLIFGVMRVINMAHGEMAMIAAMLTYALATIVGIPVLASVALAMVGAGLAGLIIHKVAIQSYVGSRELTVVLSTLGVSLVLLHGGVTLFGSQPRSIRLSFDRIFSFGGVVMTVRGVLIIIVAVVAMLVLQFVLTRTSTGKMWRATAQNTTGAQLIGIDTRRVFSQTLIAASVLAGLAGILLAVLNSARPDMGQSLLITGFAVVIVAGMGSITGTLIVGMAMGLGEALFAQYISSDLRQIFIYSLLILALLFRPEGIFGTQRRVA
jgi:branched-chain amino acid transport system permease protein